MSPFRIVKVIVLICFLIGIIYWNFMEFYTYKFYREKRALQQKYLIELGMTYQRFLIVKKNLEDEKRIVDQIIDAGFSPSNYKAYSFSVNKIAKWEELEAIINMLNFSYSTILYKPSEFQVSLEEKKGKRNIKIKDFKVNIKGDFIARMD